MPEALKKRIPELLLVGIVLFIHIPVAFADVNQVLPWFNADDAFYYFKTAQNIAEGRGITFDGIGLTNGFHPLWMIVIVPVFSLARFDLILPLRILAVILMLLNIGSSVLLIDMLRRHLSYEIAFIAALVLSLLPDFHNWTTKNGLEIGLMVFLIVLFLHRLEGMEHRVVQYGLLGSLVVLSRLDTVFFVYFMGVWIFFQVGRRNAEKVNPLSDWWQPVTRRIGYRNTFLVRQALGYYLPLTLVLLAYMTWGQLTFDTPIPISGQVKRWWGTLENSVYGFPPERFFNFIGQFFTDDRSIGPWSIVTSPFYGLAENVLPIVGLKVTTSLRRVMLIALTMVGGLGASGLIFFQRRFVWQTIQGFGMIPLLLGSLAQITYYKASGSVAQREWYWMMENLFILLSAAILLEIFVGWLARVWSRNRTQQLLRIVIALAVVALVTPHIPRTFAIITRKLPDQDSFYLRRARWLESHTESGSLIGMTGTGSSGYFTQDRVLVNLDGLISSQTYFQHMKEGTAGQYLVAVGLDYVFGNEYIVTESDPYGGIFEGRLTAQTAFIDGEKVLVLWQFIP